MNHEQKAKEIFLMFFLLPGMTKELAMRCSYKLIEFYVYNDKSINYNDWEKIKKEIENIS